jgi:CheY-like chemotaxis protein
MNILLADDDPVSRKIVTTILAKWPEHRVIEVEDGESAWKMLNDTGRHFDVAFLDIQMPRLSGLELLARIHQSPFFRSVQVVLFTTAKDRATITKAIGLGVKHYLVKPCTEEAIAEKLRQISAAVEANAR